MTDVIISSELTDGHQTLVCPSCNEGFLHQDRVEVFDRQEDADTGAHVVVEGGVVTVDSDQEGNPSRRRDGVRIRFRCGICAVVPVLTIIQHKGNTFVAWEVR